MLGNADPSLGNTCLLEGGLLLLLNIQATRTLQVPWQTFSKQHSDQRGNSMYHFLVIFEKGAENYGAYAPDLPGCVAVGDTLEATKKNMHEAIEMHIQGMIEDNEPIPISQSTACYMDITLPDSGA